MHNRGNSDILHREQVPADNSGPVKVIVGSTYETEVNTGGKWTFLEAYAPWCGHCKKLTPVWEDLGKAFSHVDNIVIAKVLVLSLFFLFFVSTIV